MSTSTPLINANVAVRPLDRNTASKGQYLAPDNASPNIDEGLEVRIKDPLWFLARQWQTSEFEAENGGKLAQLEVTSSSYPIDELQLAEELPRPIPAGAPLQPLVESETDNAGPSAWRTEALEYEFGVRSSPFDFAAEDYRGLGLDWYHFDLETVRSSRPARFQRSRRVVPTNLSFASMPHPRWWRFEEGTAHVDTLHDVEPNPLSLILPEFLIADANNWFVVPLDQRVGTVREIDEIKTVDSFGVVSEVPPVSGVSSGWQIFTHAALLEGGEELGSRLLVVADVGNPTVEGEPIEEVVFLRDEDANLVWAVEELFWDPERGMRVRPGPESGPEAPAAAAETRFRLRSEVAANWVPYLPRRIEALMRRCICVGRG